MKRETKEKALLVSGAFMAGIGFKTLCSKIHRARQKKKAEAKLKEGLSKKGEEIFKDFADSVSGKTSDLFDDDE